MKHENALYKTLDWQTNQKTPGMNVTLDMTIYHLSELLIVPIDEDEQSLIDQYDAARHQKDTDKNVFFAAWDDGEWQPRATYPDYDVARKAVQDWFFDFTQELVEALPKIDAEDVFALERLLAAPGLAEGRLTELFSNVTRRGLAVRSKNGHQITEAGREWLRRNVAKSDAS